MASIEELLKRYPPRDIPVDLGSASVTAPWKIPVGQATEMGGRPTPQAPQAAPAPTAATAPTAQAARTMPKSISRLGAIGAAVGGADEALKVGKVAANSNATMVDVGTQASEGAGRLAAAGTGAATGAALGLKAAPALAAIPVVGPAAAVAAPVLGGIGGAAYGYWAGNKAIEGGRQLAGVDTRSPVDRLAAGSRQVAQPAAATPATATPAPQPQLPQADYSNEGRTRPRPAIDQSTGPSAPAGGNVVTFDPKTNTYSGTNITEGATITGGMPGGRGTGRIGVSVLGGSSEARGQGALAAQPFENEAANSAAANQYTLMRAEQTMNPFAEDTARRTRAMEAQQLVQNGLLRRRDVGAYLNQEADRVDKRRSENQLARLKAAELGTNANVTMRGQDLTAQTVAARDLGDRAASTARDRTLLDISKLQTDARTTTAEQAANARAAAAEAAANRYMVVPTQEIVMTPDGPQSLQRSRVFNPATGKVVDLGGQQSTGVQVTPKDEYDKMPKGARYIGPDGKAYIKG